MLMLNAACSASPRARRAPRPDWPPPGAVMAALIGCWSVDAAATEPTRLGRFEVEARGERTVLSAPLIGAIEAGSVEVQTLATPPRLVVDIANTAVVPKFQRVHVGALGVRKARVATRGSGVRLVLDLAPASEFPATEVEVRDGRLQLRLSTPEPTVTRPGPVAEASRSAGPEPKAPKTASRGPESSPSTLSKATDSKATDSKATGPKASVASAPSTPPEERSASAPRPAVAARTTSRSEELPPSARAAPSQPYQVENVRFEPKDGFYRLTVDFDRKVDGLSVIRRGSEEHPELRVSNVALSAELERTLDVTGLAAEALSSVSSYGDDGTLVLSARIEDSTEHRHWLRGQALMWDFRSNLPRVAGYDDEGTASTGALAATAGRIAPGRERYTGRRISLDLKDADVQNVLRLLADVSKLNIVASEDVTGKITIKLRNVPWDQALDVVLAAKGLDKVRNGNIIRVAPATTLRKEEQLAADRLQTQLRLEPLTVRLIPLSYATAESIAPKVQSLLSERGKVSVDTRTNVLIVEDIAANLVRAERLVRTLDTQTPQVLIEARIVEARSSFSREVGIQWGGRTNFNRRYGNQTGLEFPNSIGLTGGADDRFSGAGAPITTPNYAVNLPATVGTGGGGALGLVLGSLTDSAVLNLRLSAAEAVGRIKIVSAPRVVTLDNEEARILSGERVPITVLTANGPTTRFINANIELKVRPHVTQDGSIFMKVSATKNELSDRVDFLGVPGILIKEAETQMIVDDGDTAVLGGLYKRNTAENDTMIPWLGNIPVLGWLFKRNSREDLRDELLIFISPRIVNRSSALVSSE